MFQENVMSLNISLSPHKYRNSLLRTTGILRNSKRNSVAVFNQLL